MPLGNNMLIRIARVAYYSCIHFRISLSATIGFHYRKLIIQADGINIFDRNEIGVA